MVLKLETAPASEPLTTSEAKAHLKVSGSSEDAYIDSLVKASRTSIEKYLNRALITQTWKVYFDEWDNKLSLGLPAQSITSVKYYDYTGSLTLLDSDLYYSDIISEPARVVRKYDSVYPELEEQRPNGIVVEFVAGYGDASTDVPADILHAVKLVLADYYDNKGEVVVGTIAVRIQGHIKNLLHPYRLYDFAN